MLFVMIITMLEAVSVPSRGLWFLIIPGCLRTWTGWWCFRPLSGIMVSNNNPFFKSKYVELFPSPLGDYGF